MPYLDFKQERDTGGDSWQRANPDAALIEQVDTNTYLVLLPGGETHECSYGTERSGRVGYCDCKGWEFRDDDNSPCAHLCTLRKAEFIDGDDVRGQPIKAESTIGEIEPGATEPEPEVRADGGRRGPDEYTAGSDGETFGRPEGQL